MSGTIVCVDDEPALCRVLQLVLAKTGAPVRAFTDPLEALEFVSDHDVALVVCDYRMPTLTGLEVLQRLSKPVPFVMLSGDLDITRIVNGRPGVTAVISKPFVPEQLLAIALDHLRA